jgi:hypothetical protein
MQQVCDIVMTVLKECSNVKLACRVLSVEDMRQGKLEARNWSIDEAWVRKESREFCLDCCLPYSSRVCLFVGQRE